MKKLAQRQISEKIKQIKELKPHLQGVNSWVRYIRKALGMTSAQLASRMDLAKSSLDQIERQEAQDKVSLRSLIKAANALDCDFIYALVPRTSIDEMVSSQAQKKALEIIKASHLQMEYEDQDVSQAELKQQVIDLSETLKDSKKLWDEE